MKSTRGNRQTLFAFLRLVLAMASLVGAFAAEKGLADPSSALPFVFGESCEQLFDLVDDELRTLTNAVNSESFARLCVPEWPNTCADYSSVVSPFGELQSSSNDYFCHFKAK